MLQYHKIFSKKGVSVMIGYVLLVSLAVVMGGVMYAWMKSYVPTEEIKCPDGTSIQVLDYNYSCTEKILDIAIKNNGRFDLGGYYVRASQDPDENIAGIDLTEFLENTGGGITKFRNAIIFGADNLFGTGSETLNSFDLSGLDQIAFIEITPARWETIDNVKRFAICDVATTTKETIECD